MKLSTLIYIVFLMVLSKILKKICEVFLQMKFQSLGFSRGFIVEVANRTLKLHNTICLACVTNRNIKSKGYHFSACYFSLLRAIGLSIRFMKGCLRLPV